LGGEEWIGEYTRQYIPSWVRLSQSKYFHLWCYF